MRDLAYFLRYLYGAIRLRVFVWLFFIVGAAFLEGLTVGIFFPILEGANEESSFTRAIINAFEFFNLDYSLSLVLVFMVIFYLIRTGFVIYQETYAKKIVTRLLIATKCELVDKLYRADYRYFLSREVGYFTNAVTLEYTRVAVAFELCMALLVAAGFALVYFALPLVMNPALTGIVIALSIPGYFIIRKVNQVTRDYSLRATANNARLQSYLIQAFHNFRYLKATHSGEGILRKVYGASEEQGSLYYRQAVLQAFTGRSTELFLMVLVAALLFYHVVILGVELVSVLFLLFLVRRAVTFALAAQESYRKFVGTAGSVKLFRDLEAELSEHREDLKSDGAVPDFDQPIRLEGVSLTYDDVNYALKDINLVIPPRQTTALVGASGAGKSTFVTLLTGLLKPSKGEVYLGDDRYADIDQILLRRGIGYVTQESVIFNETIRDNITLWSDGADEDNLKAAAAGAHLTEFIERSLHGYDTVLGDSGLNISGGQRQRISIARELFKNVKLLIFDEATSSLDTHAEREIQRNIDEFRGEKTVVIIAHRLSTVTNADMILVLKDGEIVEQGAYDELYALGGEFKAMVDEQALWGATPAKASSG